MSDTDGTIVVTAPRFNSAHWLQLLQKLKNVTTQTPGHDWSRYGNFNSLTPKTAAETFAEQAIVYGPGFDPNNPEHQ